MPALDGFVAVSELVSYTDWIADVAASDASTAFAASLVTAINALPTSDPAVAGALYLNSGVLTVSTGP